MTSLALSAFLLAAAPAAEAPLHVRIADSMSCPSAAQLLEALDQRLGPGRAILGGSGQGVAVMEVFAGDGSQFTVRLTSTSAHLTAESTLDSHRGSCVELARAVALLAESWLREMPSERDLVGLTPPPEAEPVARVIPAPATRAVVRTAPRSEPREHTPLVALSVSGDWVVSTSTGLGGSLTLEFALPARFGVGLQFSLLPTLNAADPNLEGASVTIKRFSGAVILTYLFAGSKI